MTHFSRYSVWNESFYAFGKLAKIGYNTARNGIFSKS